MMLKRSTQLLAVGLSLLISVPSRGYQNPESADSAGGAADAAPMSAAELQALVAPIALYPDALVAQILAAATFPDQVAVADYWVQQNHQLTGASLMQAVDKQSWDASVKALTQFPTVLDNLAKNLTWTSSLGEAYHDQASEVMAAVQALRAKAKAEGNLKSTPQMSVVQQTPQTIVIQPANPQVVYVPEYNPAVVYGYPYVTPGYTAAAVASGALAFGAGIALGSLGGGWNSWNCNWGGGAVVYNHNNFYGNSAWHGGYYNGGYHDGYGYHNAYNKTTVNNFHGTANRVNNLNREEDRNFNADRADSWSHDDSAFGRSNAFSGLGDRFGGAGGWASRANSFRGWGSMRAGGFSGGRFGGGGFHGFGGGGFHGGGFRR
uniref:DUF3300 domain-containing protein n=1 Tax=Solibacter usitatus (strain Ellin6076) TaxID=234267 RepID=Q01Z70_SOLUE